MSNSRKMKRSVKRNVSAVSMAALGTVTVGGMLMATAGTAFAATPTLTQDAVGAATTVYPGGTAAAGANITLTISNTFSAGDVIDIPIVDNNGAPADTLVAGTGLPAGQTGTVAQSVAFAAAPTVTVTNTTPTPSTSDVAPTIKATLATNPNDSVANKTAGTTDMLVLSISNSAAGTAGDTYSIAISGTTYNIGAAAPLGSVWAEPVYQQNSGAGSGPYFFTSTGTISGTTGTPLNTANIQGYSVTETPTGVPSGATAAPIANLALKEVNPATFPASTTNPYTIAANNGAKLAGTATITATGFTIASYTAGGTPACGTASSSITVAANTAGQYQFCVVTQTSTATGGGSLTVSNMAITPATTSGTVTITATDSGGGIYKTALPAVTVVSVPTAVAGYTADDTAAQAATAAANGNTHAVVLASDAEYQDALAASYLVHAKLAAQDATGTTINGGSTENPILLNPYDATDESTTAAAQVIRKLGIGTVYIVGGTAAISQDVQNQLAKTQIGTANGQPVYLQVIRIAGQTAEQTAAMVAQYPLSQAGTLPATPGAYGMYNSGASESTTPTAAAAGGTPTTAILADADEFQDALSASPLASRYQLPVLLNAGGQALDSNAASALSNLHVQQVIVVGGSSAISDSAVQSLQAAGYSVLRIAGTTFDQTSNLLGQFEVNDYAAPVANTTVTVAGLNIGNAGIVGQPAPPLSLEVGTSRGDAYQDALASAQVLGASTTVGTNTVNLVPLLLNSGTGTLSTGAGNFLSQHGPNASFAAYTAGTGTGAPVAEQIATDQVFGGSLAQTPALVQSELNSIAAG